MTRRIEYRRLEEFVAGHAAAAPDRVALLYRDRAMTYGELVAKAEALASHLGGRGVGPGRVVAVLADRSPEMAVGLLATLTAGAAYLAIDPALPRERVAFLLADSGARLALTTDQYDAEARGHGLDTVRLDVHHPSAPFARPAASVDDPAYVTYTSGSTGEPKGAMIPHRSVPGYLLGVRYADFDAGQTFLQHSSVSWDVLTLELWSALLTGARCVLYPERVLTVGDLDALVSRHGVSIVWLTAAMFHAMLDEAPEVLARVPQVLTGGDVVSLGHARRALELLPRTRLTNGYGPSECTVFAACYPVRAPLPAGLRSLPVGRPVGDRRVYVLDRGLRRCPVGVPGEVYIGGPAVALGYRRRAGLTARSFVPDPFGREPGGRLYKTGDRARIQPDGNLEFLGRVDRQVKVRGHRVEMAEVEAALGSHPDVFQAAVAAPGGPGGERRLVGFVVPRREPGPDAAALRRFLRGRLPEYQIPSLWVPLDRLPLNEHGKVDRAALLSQSPRASEAGPGAPPRTPIEEALVEVWGELLATPVGIHDDFFALGGHSLVAMQVLARVRGRFGAELSVRSVFDAPTVAEFARLVEGADSAQADAAIPPVRGLAKGEPHPMSAKQERMWRLSQIEPDLPYYNVFFGIEIEGGLDPEALRHAWAELHARHGSLRCAFPLRDGRPVLAVEDVPPPWEEIDAGPGGRPAGTLATETAAFRFDVGRAPLYRVRLAHRGPNDHQMLVVFHHLIVDGWSLGVLLRELLVLYAARRAGMAAPLAPVGLQGWDYAAWKNRLWAEGHLRRQLDYWLRLFETPPDSPPLPTDRPRPPEPTFRGAHHAFALPEPVGARVVEFCRREGVTPFVVYLTAFMSLLHRHAGGTEVCVGVPSACRTRPELQGVVGLCMNMLPVRVALRGEPSFCELARRVRDAALGAFENEDLPLGTLQAELARRHDLKRSPLYRVMFSLLPAPEAGLGGLMQLGGLRCRPVTVEVPISQVDLTLEVFEDGSRPVGKLEYNTDLFDEATARHWGREYAARLAAALADPAGPVAALPADSVL